MRMRLICVCRRSGKSAPTDGEVWNMGYLAMRNNSVANCRRPGTRINTGPEVFAMLKDDCRFEPCHAHLKKFV